MLTEEYVKAFILKKGNNLGGTLSTEDKRKRFFYFLNTSGIYHTIKENLKVNTEGPSLTSTL
jgi:hypothetical protein